MQATEMLQKVDKMFMETHRFQKAEINGVTNYYQPNAFDHDGKTHFYRLSHWSNVVAVETANNFQDAVRNIYEDSSLFPLNADDDQIKNEFRHLGGALNNGVCSPAVNDEHICTIYQNIVKALKDMEIFQLQKWKDKLYFICQDHYYRINFDYTLGFVLEVAYGFEQADAHIHQVLGTYPLSLQALLLFEMKNVLLAHLSVTNNMNN